MNANYAQRIAKRAGAWDNHACLPMRDHMTWLGSLRRYKNAGFSVVHVNVGDGEMSVAEIIGAIAFARRLIAENPTDLALVGTIAEVDAAKERGALAVCFDLEGAFGLGENLDLVSLLYDVGVRWMLVAYNRGNLVGGGCHDERDPGLSTFGSAWVTEMERVGMIVDIAHTGYRTALDVCAMATRPVNISHSNPRALRAHPRCVPDEVMKACAATGGVLGISGVGIFLGENDNSTAAVIASIDRAVQIMGIDHVGLGLDFVFDRAELDANLANSAHIWPPQFGYRPGIKFVEPERLTDITLALGARGYAEAEITKILGGNFRRVASQVWR